MGKALEIVRPDHTGTTLRALAGKCRDGAQVRRLLALAMVLDGRPCSIAASSNGMDRQTLRDWVHHYNDEAVDGLKTHRPSGREPYLTVPQLAELYELVINGPFGIKAHESTMGKWLHKLGLTDIAALVVMVFTDGK